MEFIAQTEGITYVRTNDGITTTHQERCSDSFCMVCGSRDCPYNDILHYAAEECPSCSREKIETGNEIYRDEFSFFSEISKKEVPQFGKPKKPTDNRIFFKSIKTIPENRTIKNKTQRNKISKFNIKLSGRTHHMRAKPHIYNIFTKVVK